MQLATLDRTGPASMPPPVSEPHPLPNLTSPLGAQVAALLSPALERVTALARSGSIDRGSLRALQDELEQARRLALKAQQIMRLATGEVALSAERLDPCALLQSAIDERQEDLAARGIELRVHRVQARVQSDATLLYSLFQALLDWGLEHTIARMDLHLTVRAWPLRASARLSFDYQPAGQGQSIASASALQLQDPRLDTLTWHLLTQIATTLRLPIQRHDAEGRTQLQVDFPQTLAPALSEQPDERHAAPAPLAHHGHPLADRVILVVAARREVRDAAREALLSCGVQLRLATSLEEAVGAALREPPHAVIHEAAVSAGPWEVWQRAVQADCPGTAFITLTDGGKPFELQQAGEDQRACVSVRAIRESLPAALLFELSRRP